MMTHFVAYWKNLYTFRHVLAAFTRQSLLAKYRHSFLGVIWAWLSPLCMVLIIGFVFGTILGRNFREFIPFLYSGLIPWLFLVACADGGANSFVSAEGYIKQIRLPIEIFPAKVTIFNFINMLISLCALYIILLAVSPESFTLHSLLVLPAFVVVLALGLSIATISAVFNTFVRDFAHLQSLALQALFYLTPIIYAPEMLLNGRYGWVVWCNPFYYIIGMLRNALLGQPSQWKFWIMSIGMAFLLNGFAIFLIRKAKNKIVMQL